MQNSIENAVNALRKGEIILVHDKEGRENETDFVFAAQYAKAEYIAQMRQDAGGLICVAIGREIAENISIPHAADINREASKVFPTLSYLTPNDIPYDEKSSFSIMVNHRGTFTGVTDEDRALTIRELGKLSVDVSAEEFGRVFRSPGHIPLLRSSGLDNREGHTELSVALMKLAGLTPIACICEMMDAKTHKALSSEKAREYASGENLVFLETEEIKKAWEGRNG